MEYFIKATTTSPLVLMDSMHKSILIKGSSICSDMKAYEEVKQNIKKNLAKHYYENLNIKLDVFNVCMAKNLIDLMKSIKNDLNMPTPKITWMYDSSNEEMKKMGKDYSKLLDMEFDISCN